MISQLNGCPHFFVFLFWYLFSLSKLWPVDCGLSMWGKIMIPMYRLWLHSLFGLYGPCCPLSPERPLNLITHSLPPGFSCYRLEHWMQTSSLNIAVYHQWRHLAGESFVRVVLDLWIIVWGRVWQSSLAKDQQWMKAKELEHQGVVFLFVQSQETVIPFAVELGTNGMASALSQRDSVFDGWLMLSADSGSEITANRTLAIFAHL